MNREWLVTNGLGGYASGTLAGALTRRYHSLLTAALPAPLGRIVLLNYLIEHITLNNGNVYCLGAEHTGNKEIIVHGAKHLVEFHLDHGIPVWKFDIEGIVLEKRIFMPHLQNTVFITYSFISGESQIELDLRPSLQFRAHEAPLGKASVREYVFTAESNRYEIKGAGFFPVLRLCTAGVKSVFILDGGAVHDVHHHLEAERGYEALARLWTPGFIKAKMSSQNVFTLIASCEDWDALLAMEPREALGAELSRRMRLTQSAQPAVRNGIGAELVIAADQFIISPSGRVSDTVKTHASGDEARSVIAGYHWFTDWGRDTMISLEGLTLVTGRFTEAGWIIRTFANYIKDGLIPNLFPEGGNEGLYHTADATLWFFHALNRYIQYTNDHATLHLLLDKLIDIVHHHLEGTKFSIAVDHSDGLLSQGREGYQLTWMDAKVEDWVVTPRRGKAVEINALWYNCLMLLDRWISAERGARASQDISDLARKVYQSFNKRFWYEKGGYLYDVVDGENGDDTSCRPNQIFSISLDFPVLDKSRWNQVVGTVEEKLLTPFGLRSLCPEHPDYKPKYYGNLRSRDAAYHQGTVWAWLIGPFIDAWLKIHPDDLRGAAGFLDGFTTHLNDACVGSISEIFDAEAPFHPRGCIAQAWSVAEVLRCRAAVNSRLEERREL